MTVTRRLPEWFKVPMPGGPNYMSLREQFRSEELHTVCEEAQCPNIGDCWERRTATFMILRRHHGRTPGTRPPGTHPARRDGRTTRTEIRGHNLGQQG